MNEYQVKDITQEGQFQTLEFFRKQSVINPMTGSPMLDSDEKEITTFVSVGMATLQTIDNRIADLQVQRTFFKKVDNQ